MTLISHCRICIGAPVLVEIPDPEHEGRFRRIFAQVTAHRVTVFVQAGGGTTIVSSLPFYFSQCVNVVQRRSYVVRLGNHELVVVRPSRIATLQ